MRKTTPFIIILLLLPIATSLTITPGQTTVAPGENTYAVVCSNTTYNFSATCINDSQITTQPWTEGCYMHSLDTSNPSCYDMEVSAETQVERTEKTIEINNYRNTVAEHSGSDNNDPLSIAKNIYAQHLLGEDYTFSLERLKTLRDNDLKCWPDDDCELDLTAEILLYLSRTDIDRESRVFDDALNYVEARQNEYDNTDWNLRIESDNEATCSFYLDDNLQEEFTFNGTDEREIEFDYSANTQVNVTCDDDFEVRIEDSFGQAYHIEQEDDDEQVLYYLPGGCWPMNNDERVCSIRTTAIVLGIEDLETEHRESGTQWVEANVDRAMIIGERLVDEDNPLINVLLYDAVRNEQLREWLFFTQNNDGSFGETNEERNTLEAIRAFEDVQDKEWVRDAKEWVRENRPRNGYGDVLLDSLTYDVFRDEIQYIDTTPTLLYSTGNNIDFEATPATSTANLTASLTPYSSATLESGTGTLQVNTNENGYYTGYTIIENGSNRKDVPTIIDIKPFLRLEPERAYYTQNDTGFIRVPYEKSSAEMTCTFEYSDFFNDTTETLTDGSLLRAYYDGVSEGTYDVFLQYSCETDLGDFDGESAIQIRHYNHPPFTSSISNEEIINIETLTVQNLLDEELNIGVSHEDGTIYYGTPGVISLQPDEQAEISLYQNAPSQENRSQSDRLVVSGVGHEDTHEVIYYLDGEAEVVPEDVVKNTPFPWMTVSLTVLTLIIAVSVGGYTFMQYQRQEPKNGEDDGEDEAHVVQEGPDELAEVLIAVDKTLGASDEDIEDELREEGYEDEVIDESEDALRELTEKLEALEQRTNQ